MEITAAFLKAFLGLESVEKAQEILDSEDGLQQIKELNAANLKKARDEGDSKGRGMVIKEFKKAAKAEYSVDITSEKPDEILESLKESMAGQQAEEVSEETIKAHPAYKALEGDRLKDQQKFNKEVEKKANELSKDVKADYEKQLKQVKKSGFLTELEIEAKEWLLKEGAILNSDPEKQKKQIQKFVRDIAEANDLDKDEDGKILFSKDGSPVTNSHGHNATAHDLFRDNDFAFSFKTVEERKSSGLNPNGGGNSQQKKFEHYKGEVPKDEAGMNELRNKRVNREISPEAFKEVEAAYAEQQKN